MLEIDGYIECCYNTGTVKGKEGVGGIVGWMIDGDVQVIDGSMRKGGGKVKDTYNIGTVIGSSTSASIGGIVGEKSTDKDGVWAPYPASILNSYNAGTITNDAGSKGGVIGLISDGNAEITNCYWLEGTASLVYGKNVEDSYTTKITDSKVKTSAELKTMETVTLLNAARTDGPWTRKDNVNNGYPILRIFCTTETPTLTTTPASLTLVYGDTGTITYAYNGDGAITVISSATDIFTVTVDYETSTITVSAESAGSAFVMISAAETSSYEAISTTVLVVVNKAQISEASIEGDTFVYSGTPRTPKETVTYKGKNLVKDKDYKVQYENNVNAGKGKVVIVGINNCEGTITKEFTITPMELEVEWDSQLKFKYTGNAILPKLKSEVLNGANRRKSLFKSKIKGWRKCS